jgi:hypothetical protein
LCGGEGVWEQVGSADCGGVSCEVGGGWLGHPEASSELGATDGEYGHRGGCDCRTGADSPAWEGAQLGALLFLLQISAFLLRICRRRGA